ncbi:MAG: hypothetical protein AAF236_05990 [Verrucomicrobiota bacterium]
MSEHQKLFASLSGAVVAHLGLFCAVFLLLNGPGLSGLASVTPQAGSQREVTVLFGDLLDEVERIEEEEVPEPEPEVPDALPEPEELPLELRPNFRPAIDTSLNTAVAEAPENADFESDRNTAASTELPPDATLPQEAGPTLLGDERVDHFSMKDREYVDGTLDEESGGGAGGNASQRGAGEGETAREGETLFNEGETVPDENLPVADEMREAQEAQEAQEAAEAIPEEREANLAEGEIDREPDALTLAADRIEAEMQRSFLDPSENADGFAINAPLGRLDQEATRLREAIEVGNFEEARIEEAQEEMEQQEQQDEVEAAAPQPTMAAGGASSADTGLFAQGYTPEELQSIRNGSLTNIGEGSVDAVETEMGKYKMEVRRIIGQKWHRYREKHADFVTWGRLKIGFRVDEAGKVHDLKIIDNEANAMLAEFSLKAILEAELPRMPSDVAESVGPTGLDIEYDIIIY